MTDDTQMNDNWIPVNLNIPLDHKFMDLSDFYIFTIAYATRDGEPFYGRNCKEYVHDGKNGLINKSCIDKEKSFFLYVVNRFLVIVKTDLNVLCINFINKDSVHDEVDENNHIDITKFYKAYPRLIKDMVEYITDPAYKERFIKSLKNNITYNDYHEMMSKITNMVAYKQTRKSVGYEYHMTDRVIDCSGFIVVEMKFNKELCLQLHDGSQGLITSEINNGDTDYSIDGIREEYLLLSNMSKENISVFFIDKNNSMLLETTKLFDITNSIDSNEIDINKLKLYFITLSMIEGGRLLQLLRFISRPTNQLGDYVIDSKLKEKFISFNNAASA